jgi:hypothetical protein
MATSNVIPLSATQPQASSSLRSPVTLNPAALGALGGALSSRFTSYESDRRMAELKWTAAARQYLGVYDPDVEAQIDKNRSRAYPKLTRVKCVSMLARLMNLLFQASEKNWGVCPSAVPDLSAEDLQAVLDELMPPGTDASQVPSDERIEAAICKFAEKRACRLELEIEDQLQDIGGSRMTNYVALCRKVLASGIQYGAGVLRGPFVEEATQRTWTLANGALKAIDKTVYRPRFEFVSLWDYYPDMSAKTIPGMDGNFLRQVMSKAQFVALKKRSDFLEGQIDLVLRTHPSGNYKRKPHETDIRSLGSQMNTSSGETGKFEAIVWDGYVQGSELSAAGATVSEDKLNDVVRAQVWMVGGIVIKAEVDPWSTLLPNGPEMKMYHHFIFEEDESFLLGNGLPHIMRDSQLGLCAAVRMALDNASIQRVFEINYALLRSDVDIVALNPDMLIARDDDNPATAQYPAVRAVELPMNLDKLMAMGQMFMGFADTETFVNPATGGDMQKGPSEPFRTAAGASMLRGDAALPFKDVVRNFDVFTESVISSLILFNHKFNDNPNVKGDFQPIARGATSLIAKEVQGMQLDNLAQTLTEEEKRYLNPREMLRARLRVRDMDYTAIVYDDERCDQIDAQASKTAEEQATIAAKTAEATIRKLLSDTLKNVAQANKNAAGAQAETANFILNALEKGINPDMLASATQGAGSGSESTSAGSSSGAAAPDGGEGEQPGPGLGGLEAATGAAVAAPRPRAAAMPAY